MGWRDDIRRIPGLLWLSLRDFGHDNGYHWAAATAYYSLLSAFPLILATAALAAFFVDPQWVVDQAAEVMSVFVPAGTFEMREIVDGAVALRVRASLFSLLLMLWSGSRVFGAVTQALNIAFGVDESYGFVKRNLVQLGLALSAGLLLVTALASRLLLNLAWNRFSGLPPGGGANQLVLWIVPAVLLWLAFFVVYRYVPRCRVNHVSAVAGAALATALFLIARPLFLAYLARFSEYEAIYGFLTAIIVIVLWAWVMSLIVIYSGEVAAHVQAILIEGRSGAEVEAGHIARRPLRIQKLKDELRDLGDMAGPAK